MPYEHTLIATEKQFLRQADLRKAFGSTFNERKQMSTKTSIKRIALIAVSALGFGLLSVVPSSAAASNVGATGTLTQGTAYPARALAKFYQPLTFTIASGDTLETNDTVFMSATLLAKPTGSALTSASATFESTSSSGAWTADAGGVTNDGTYTVNAARNGKTTFSARVFFEPDVAGTYQYLVYVPSALNAAYTAGNPSTVVTVTVAAGAPATATLTSLGGSTSVGETTDGAIFEVVLKDAAGNVTIPSKYESIAISYVSSGASTVTMDDYTAPVTTTHLG